MARLPDPGGDQGAWGSILNDFLSQVHNTDGTLKDDVIGPDQIQAGSVTKADVGLGNADNTSDAAKPISTATQAALDGKLTTGNNLSDLISTSTARTNLGLGAAATMSPAQLASNTAFTSAYAEVVSLGTSNGTDDTATINAALAAGAGRTIRGVPGQNYLVTSLTASVAGTTLDMTGCTITQLASATTHLLVLSGARIMVRGGTWDGSAVDNAGVAGIRIAADDCTVVEAHVIGTRFVGIYALNVNRPRIERNRITSTRYIGIFIAVSGAGADVSDPIVDGNSVDRSDQGVGVSFGGIIVHGDPANSRKVHRPRITSNTIIMPVSPTDDSAICLEVWQGCPGAVIEGNTTLNGKMGISVDASPSTTVTGNTVTAPSFYCIEVASSDLVTIAGNTVDGQTLASYGIISDGTAAKLLSVTGNTVTGVTARGISASGSLHATITGNSVEMPANTGYALELRNATAVTATGNVTTGGKKAIVLDTCIDSTAAGNTLHEFTEHGVFIYATTAVAMTATLGVNRYRKTSGVDTGSLLSGGATVTYTPSLTQPIADLQSFTANGTWTKPSGATTVTVICIGAGGGGGSGRRGAAGSVRCAGGGGGGGGITRAVIPASTLPSTVAVTVGTGGAGGTAVTSNDTNGNTGAAGGSSLFNVYARANGGGGGGGGTNAAGAAGGGGAGNIAGSAGAAASSTGNVGSGASGTPNGTAGGGSGGGITSGDSATNGGVGGSAITVNNSAAAAGVVDTTSPGNGVAAPTGSALAGGGGGGGASSVTTTAQTGGNGGIYGAGGGGGGASLNGNNSGAGGAGSDGMVLVFSV